MSALHKQSKSNPAQQITELSQRVSTMETSQQEEYTEMGLSLKNTQEELRLLDERIMRVKEFECQHQYTMSPALEQAEAKFSSINQRIQQMSDIFESQHAEMRLAHQQERENLRSLCNSTHPSSRALPGAAQREAQTVSTSSLGRLRSDLDMSQTSFKQRIDMIEEHHQQLRKLRLSFAQVEADLEELQHSIQQIEATQQQKLHELSYAQKPSKDDEEMEIHQRRPVMSKEEDHQRFQKTGTFDQHYEQRSSLPRSPLHPYEPNPNHLDPRYAQKPSKDDEEMEIHQRRHVMSKEEDHQRFQKTGTVYQNYEQRSSLPRSPLQPYEPNPNHLDPRLREMAEELQTMRSALKEKEEELKSFKDRVAVEVAPSIKTGTSMSLNSPVSKNRIREMYESLRCDWPKIKENLKSNGKKPDDVKKMVQKNFKTAKTDMEKKKMMIIKVFDLDKYKPGTEPPKVKEHMQMTIQSLQLALYSQKYEDGAQIPTSSDEVENPKEMMTYLGNECYWLGCLMALNNPPIHPDWENHPPSMDKWDILPRNIVATSVKK